MEVVGDCVRVSYVKFCIVGSGVGEDKAVSLLKLLV